MAKMNIKQSEAHFGQTYQSHLQHNKTPVSKWWWGVAAVLISLGLKSDHMQRHAHHSSKHEADELT